MDYKGVSSSLPEVAANSSNESSCITASPQVAGTALPPPSIPKSPLWSLQRIALGLLVPQPPHSQSCQETKPESIGWEGVGVSVAWFPPPPNYSPGLLPSHWPPGPQRVSLVSKSLPVPVPQHFGFQESNWVIWDWEPGERVANLPEFRMRLGKKPWSPHLLALNRALKSWLPGQAGGVGVSWVLPACWQNKTDRKSLSVAEGQINRALPLQAGVRRSPPD